MMELAQYQARSMVLGGWGRTSQADRFVSSLSALSLTSGGVTAGAEALGKQVVGPGGAQGGGVPAPYCRGRGSQGVKRIRHLLKRPGELQTELSGRDSLGPGVEGLYAGGREELQLLFSSWVC